MKSAGIPVRPEDRSLTDVIRLANPFSIPAFFQVIAAHPLFRPGMFSIVITGVLLLFWGTGNTTAELLLTSLFLVGVQALIINELGGRPVRIHTMLRCGVLCVTLGMVFFLIANWMIEGRFTFTVNGEHFFPDALNMFLAVALLEELTKGIPVIFIGLRYAKKNATLLTPISAMVLAGASAAAFSYLENMMVYVNSYSPQIDDLVTMIVRVSLHMSGHISYSCIFGFFIGLCFQYRNFLLMLPGLFIAALLHSLWNTFLIHFWPAAFAVAVISLFLLVACIIRARQLEFQPKPLLSME